MKIKKYTMEQLAKSNPVLSREETKSFWGGFVDAGGGYVLLTWDEMVEVFGSIDDMPGYALSYADYEAHSSEPFYSFDYSSLYNGLYLDHIDQDYYDQSRDASLVAYIEGLLNVFYSLYSSSDINFLNLVNPNSSLHFSECSYSLSGFSNKVYLIPISALGSKAEEWGLINNNNQGNSTGTNNGTNNVEDKINSIIRELAAFMHVSPSYSEFVDFHNLLYNAIVYKDVVNMDDLIYYLNDFASLHFFELYDRNDEQPRQPFFTFQFYI